MQWSRSLRSVWCSLLIGLAAASVPLGGAQALPSFARQTGAACDACHVGGFGPQLTDFGRQFKLNGYVWGDVENKVPPISLMLLSSFTNTAKDQPPSSSRFNANNNVALDQVSLFYGGRITDKIGAMVQGTYDGVGDSWLLDNTDIRFANQGTLLGKDIVYGLTVNNNPTVQDLWNTTPAWGYPFVSSGLASTPVATPLLDGGVAGQVIGASAYGMWNNLLYLEFGGYFEQPGNAQTALGEMPAGEQEISGFAPYWRLGVQKQFGYNYLSVGTYGLVANIDPGRVDTAGTDRYTDLGFDASYQYMASNDHIFTVDANYIRENQDLSASQMLGNSTNASNTLNEFKINGSYTYAETVTARVAFFDIWGSSDFNLYDVSGSGCGCSANDSPNSDGFTFEVDFTPFGKDDSWLQPFVNARFGIQYTAYLNFDGASHNFDGAGTNASDNNTLYLFTWLAF
jgi:hypothetical protein